MRAVGRLSTRLSSSAWVSESIQCRSSNTSSSGCRWLSRSSSRRDGVERRAAASGRIERAQAASSTGTSSSASSAGSVGSSAGSRAWTPAGHLVAHGGVVVATLDPEVAVQQVDHRQPGRRLAVRDARRVWSTRQPSARSEWVGLPDQPRLADAGLGHQRHDLTLAGLARASARSIAARSSSRPTNGVSPRADVAWRRVRAAPAPTSSYTSTGCSIPLTSRSPSARTSTNPSTSASVAGLSRRGAGRGKLLHPRGQVDRLAHRGVVQVPIVRDQPHDHPAAVQADPDLDGGAVRPAGLVGVGASGLQHRQGGEATPGRRGPRAPRARRTSPSGRRPSAG